jgi:hypothetical protein
MAYLKKSSPMRSSSIAITLILLFTTSLNAQQVDYPDSFKKPIPLFGTDVIGTKTYPISSKNARAKAYFNQGMQLMFAFAKEDAARSFREAQKNDADCAICYWGEAWAWGSYLNGKMTAAEAPRAWAALQKALQRAELFATSREYDLIKALSSRYASNFSPELRARKDSAFANAMGELYKKYPADLDIATLYADALLILEPRRGYRDINDPDLRRIHAVLEGVLSKDIRHPGACHLYIHSTESTSKPELALPCAEYISEGIPGASHINHMPSHTWNRTGEWGKSVRANIRAWHSDQKASVDKGIAIYPSHNLHMLLFAASMDGQGAIAMQAGRDYTRLTGNNMYETLTLVRFGRFDELRKLGERPVKHIEAGVWDFGQGYAALKEGNYVEAKAHLKALNDLAETSEARFRWHDARNLLGTLSWILNGEISREQGDLDTAIRHFERAVSYYDRLEYDEPEPLPFSPRHWLGAAYVDKGEFNNALNTYRKQLTKHPKNGWSLYGMLQAYELVNRENAEVRIEFEEAWKRSDTWIRGSVF